MLISLKGAAFLETEYIRIIKDNVVYFGGNQSWFDDNIRKTACGLIAACDMELWLKSKNPPPLPFEQYRTSVEYNAKNYFYKKRLNLSGIPARLIVDFLNKQDFAPRFRFIDRRKFSESELQRVISKSLDKNLPVIIRIGENFNRLSCTVHYGNSSRQCRMRWHYITATGIDENNIIFYSWGRKGEMNLSQLYKYFGFTGGIITAE